MSICYGCGGVVGRDCYNPAECEMIARDMQRQHDEENALTADELATLAGLRAGTLVAVPRELTEAILKAFREAEARAATSGKPVNSIREMNDDLCREAWPAMLAAAKDAQA